MSEPLIQAAEPARPRSALRWALVGGLVLALILVPFALFEDRMNASSAWLISSERPRGLAAIAVASLLALDVVLPVPSSIVSTASGALFGLAGGAAVSFFGMTAGSLLALLLGRAVGRPGLRRFVGEAELARAEQFASRYGDAALVLSRPVPVLAEASALLAAACGVPAGRLLALCALSNAGISLVYAAVGALAAGAASFLLVFFGAIALPGIAMLIHRRTQK